MSVPPAGAPSGGFVLTRWSMVLATADSDQQQARRALTWLCEAYWQPLVDHARYRGMGAHEAQDVVQDFFARLLEKRDLAADPLRGRFRSYLIGALNHFLANHWDRQRALKRGGGIDTVPLGGPSQELADRRTPEQVFARAWAVTVLERVLAELEREYQAPKRALLFAALKAALTADGTTQSHATVGERLGMSEGAIKVAVHRLRSRYRELLRQEIAQTVSDPADVQAELRELMEALRA